MGPHFIGFPLNQQTLRTIKQSFYAVAHFPNVVGAIDCTHVAIKAPAANEEAYVNRKGVHSINVQAVCDADMRLLDVVAKWPGSSHDTCSFIWRSSGLRDMFSRGLVDHGGWLLRKSHTPPQSHQEFFADSLTPPPPSHPHPSASYSFLLPSLIPLFHFLHAPTSSLFPLPFS